MASVLILLCSCSKYYQSERRLAFSSSKSESYIERLKSDVFHYEQIARMKNRTLNYKLLENTKISMNEFEKYKFDIENVYTELNHLAQSNISILQKWIIRRDKLSGELFLGSSRNEEITEHEELYINSQKVNLDDVQELPAVDTYIIEYKKYTYDNCNKKLDTFLLYRVIELSAVTDMRQGF